MPIKEDADRQRSIFSKNLTYHMQRAGKNIADLSSDLSFAFSTVSDWVHGKKYPRMDKVQILADYFGVMKSDLTEERPTNSMPSKPLYPPSYDKLTPANREIVDRLIADLVSNQSSE